MYNADDHFLPETKGLFARGPGGRDEQHIRALSNMITELQRQSPADILARGWRRAVVNDYRQNGHDHVFYCFTKGDFQVKGEGRDDGDALDIVRSEIARIEAQYDPTRHAPKEP